MSANERRRLAPPRQAVVVVHGIGEQVPVETLRGFVRGIARDGDFVGGIARDCDEVRWRADEITGHSWARRCTITWDQREVEGAPTVEGARLAAPETDVFECYWAPRFRDTAWTALVGWGARILARPRLGLETSRLAGRLRRAWIVMLLVLLAGLAALVTVDLAYAPSRLSWWWMVVPGLAVALLLRGWLGRRPSRRQGTRSPRFARAVPLLGALLAVGAAFVLGVQLLSWLDVFEVREWSPVAWTWVALGAVTAAALLAVVASCWYGPIATGRAAVAAAVAGGVSLWCARVVFDAAGAGGPAVLLTSPPDVVAPLVGALVPLVLGVVALNFGDVPRYTVQSAANVEEIDRLLGDVDAMLRELHARCRRNGEPTYERIVVVGHSLGSVIAYDALRLYWARVHGHLRFGRSGDRRSERFARASGEVERAAERLRGGDAEPEERERFRRAQRELWEVLAHPADPGTQGAPGPTTGGRPARWAVSDLVTLGSPLAHAELLLADDHHEFKRNFCEGVWPQCPPRAKERSESSSVTYADEDRCRAPRESAMFAACRWTNVAWGRDPIGGPVAPVFGEGVHDEVLGRSGNANTADLFSGLHSAYWKPRDAAMRRRGFVTAVDEQGFDRSIEILRAVIVRPPRVVITAKPEVATALASSVDGLAAAAGVAVAHREVDVRALRDGGRVERLVLARPLGRAAWETLTGLLAEADGPLDIAHADGPLNIAGAAPLVRPPRVAAAPPSPGFDLAAARAPARGGEPSVEPSVPVAAPERDPDAGLESLHAPEEE